MESIAYSAANHSFNTSKQRNLQVRTQVESAFTDYLHVSKPEDFLYFNELHNVAKCQHTFNVQQFEGVLVGQVRDLKTNANGYAAMVANVAEKVSDKTDFISEKMKFMEACEEEMHKLLRRFDERIDQIDQIEAGSQAQIKKIGQQLGDEDNASYNKVIESQNQLHEAREELQRKLREERAGTGSGQILDTAESRRILGLEQVKQDGRGMIVPQRYMVIEDNANDLEEAMEEGQRPSQNCLAIKLQHKLDQNVSLDSVALNQMIEPYLAGSVQQQARAKKRVPSEESEEADSAPELLDQDQSRLDDPFSDLMISSQDAADPTDHPSVLDGIGRDKARPARGKAQNQDDKSGVLLQMVEQHRMQKRVQPRHGTAEASSAGGQ